MEVHFDMNVRTVTANNKVEADRGRVAIERGPVVYCAEWADNDFDVLSVLLNPRSEFKVIERKDLLCGINQIQTQAQSLEYDKAGRLLVKDRILTLIPYYAWAHRGTGNMAVWLPDEVNATRPKAIPTLASKSKIDASHKIPTLFSVADGLIPQDENDRTIPYYHWYPKTGTTEWISYEFPEEVQVFTSTVYWFDDTPWGSCSIPKSWKIYYKNTEGKWLPVENLNAYSIVKGEGSAVKFKTVKTKAIKLEVVLHDEKTAGIYEWQIK